MVDAWFFSNRNPVAPCLLLRSLFDRVVTLGIKAQQIPGLLHMRRQRRRYINRSTARVRYRDTASQKMKLVLKSARQLPVFFGEILWVSDNRIANMRHMRAELMGTASDWLE